MIKKSLILAFTVALSIVGIRDIKAETVGKWQQNNGVWKYYDANGNVHKSWLNQNGTWYYLDKNTGDMLTKWQLIDGAWYFFDNNINSKTYGAMQKAWQWIDGYCYYFGEQGNMYAKMRTNDGYMLSDSGAWVDKDGKPVYIAGKGFITKGLNIGLSKEVNTGLAKATRSGSGGGGGSRGGSGGGGGSRSSSGGGSQGTLDSGLPVLENKTNKDERKDNKIDENNKNVSKVDSPKKDNIELPKKDNIELPKKDNVDSPKNKIEEIPKAIVPDEKDSTPTIPREEKLPLVPPENKKEDKPEVKKLMKDEYEPKVTSLTIVDNAPLPRASDFITNKFDSEVEGKLPEGTTFTYVEGKTVNKNLGDNEVSINVKYTDGSKEVVKTVLKVEDKTAPDVSEISFEDKTIIKGEEITPIDVPNAKDNSGKTPKITVDGLPDGLVYENNIIRGRATVLGIYNIVIKYSDDNLNTAEKTFNITVKDKEAPVPTPGLGIGTDEKPKNPKIPIGDGIIDSPNNIF